MFEIERFSFVVEPVRVLPDDYTGSYFELVGGNIHLRGGENIQTELKFSFGDDDDIEGLTNINIDAVNWLQIIVNEIRFSTGLLLIHGLEMHLNQTFNYQNEEHAILSGITQTRFNVINHHLLSVQLVNNEGNELTDIGSTTGSFSIFFNMNQ